MGAKPSKLTDAEVRWIRRIGYPRYSQNELARKFGVSLGYINDIIHMKRRRNVCRCGNCKKRKP